MTKMVGVRIFGLLLLLGGLGLLGLSWHLGQQQRQFAAGATQAPGTVESLYRHDYLGKGGHPTHSMVPLVRFRDQRGQPHWFEATSAASRPSSYTVGKQVLVDYDPASPDRGAQLHAPVAQHVPAVVTGLLGLVTSGLGLLCLLVFGRSQGTGANSSQTFSRTWHKG